MCTVFWSHLILLVVECRRVFIYKNLLFLGETGKYLRQFEGIAHFHVVFWFLKTPDCIRIYYSRAGEISKQNLGDSRSWIGGQINPYFGKKVAATGSPIFPAKTVRR